MLLYAYKNRNTNWKEAENREITSTLQPIEIKLMERLDLVEIVGKRNRKVPVLLAEDMRNAIDILVAKRADVGVPKNNKYLFAAPSTENGYLRGWDALNVVTRKAGLKKAELLTFTNLRKYVATVYQVIGLGSNNELKWLANHMEHTITVHRQFYRLQEQTLELAKVSKLLVAVDNGTCHKYAGKSLDQITLEELPDARCNDEDVDDNENSSNASLDSVNQKESSDAELMFNDTDCSDENSEDSDVAEKRKKKSGRRSSVQMRD
ncbi:hypothetical protein KP79_PYT26191 [Mizuhopecten yessoensis]|uniref:Uncharacterized protein n=1 Tax=Mizuhopecten yessoensis TaxID=6573 RepID=A0A210QEU1_MIZYE|nr:hypothetical protein KP79_PYT26191 [Mizuhopecten yessoensis]